MDIAGKTTAELLEIYNKAAAAQNKPTVKRFADRKTAERRVNALLNGAGKPVAQSQTEQPPSPKATKPAAVKPEGELVKPGSFRAKLLAALHAKLGQQQSVTALMKATYGEPRKDFKGPLMMVIKGLRKVLTANQSGFEIRKTRELKENHFGLHKKNH